MAKKAATLEDDDEKPQRKRGSEEDGEESEGVSSRFNPREIAAKLKNWALENKLKAGIIGGSILLVLLVALGLYIWHRAAVAARPTLEMAFATLEAGHVPHAKAMAMSVLKYADSEDNETRAAALFILGITTSKQADAAFAIDKQPFYLTAANYLAEAQSLGFPEEHKAEGDYQLGKCYYLAGDHLNCRAPLLRSLEAGAGDKKTIYRLLANTYFKDSQPDFEESLRYVELYRKLENVTQDESNAAHLLRLMILIRQGNLGLAKTELETIPNTHGYASTYHFVKGLINLEEARDFRTQAERMERQYLLEPPADLELPKPPEPVVPPEVPPVEVIEPSNPPETGSSPVGATGQPDASSVKLDEPGTPPVPVPGMESPAPATPSTEPPAPEGPTPVIPGVLFNPSRGTLRLYAALLPSIFILQEPPIPPAPFDPTAGETVDPGKPVVPAPETPAPASVAEQARNLRMDSLMKYDGAIKEFDNTQNTDAEEFLWSRQSIMLQGICLEEMGKFDDAIRIYSGLTEGFPDTNEALAGIFLKADIEERLGRPDDAMLGYRLAIARLKRTPAYANPWLGRDTIYERVENAFTRRLEAEKYQSAFDILKVLDTVLPKGRIARMCAVGLLKWAESLQKRADAAAPDQREPFVREMREKYRLGGDWFRELARWEYETDQYVEDIWNSAECHRLGGAYNKSIPMYLKYAELQPTSRNPQLLVYVGEMYFELDALDKAEQYLGECLNLYDSRNIAYYARLLASYVQMEKKNWTKAKELLERNLSGVMGPSSSEYRDSLFALGRLYYRQKNYEQAIIALEDACTLHPNAIQAPESHYFIAMGYMEKILEKRKVIGNQLAEEQQRIQIQISEWQIAALDHLEKAQRQITQRQDAMDLTVAEQKMLRNCYFAIGNAMSELGPEYREKAILAYELAVTRYQNLSESIQALVQMAKIYRAQNQEDKAKEIIGRAKILLARLTAAGAFPPGKRFTSGEWEELLRWQERQ